MVANFTALQLFSAYNIIQKVVILEKICSSVKYQLIHTSHLSICHDTKMAIYRCTQILYLYTFLVYMYIATYIHNHITNTADKLP